MRKHHEARRESKYKIIMKKLSLIITSVLFLQYFLAAQSLDPINSNYLIAHGVSPRVLDAAASIFMQDGKFRNDVQITINKEGFVKDYHVELIYDPAYKAGMDIRIVNHSQNLNKKEKKKLSKYIEASHYFSRMSRSYLYDESSLKVIKNEDGNVVFEFYYQDKDIDPYLKSIKRVKGEIYFENGVLKKVVLNNTKPLKHNFDRFTRTVYYSKTNDGGYIVSSVEENSQSTKKKISYKLVSKTIDYTTESNKKLVWNNKKEVPAYTKTNDTIDVKLGGVLPFLGKEATKIGYKLPRPIGVAGFTYIHSQLMEFTGLAVSLDDNQMVDLQNLFMLDESTVTQTTNMTMAKADVWIFPFLNIGAIVGGGENKLDGELVINEELRDFINDLPGYIIEIPNIPRAIPINMKITSEIYGGMATLAGGIGNFNLSINYQLLFTKIVEANTLNTVNIITPMVGYMTPFGLNIMLGAQGQFYNTQIKGFFELDDIDGNPHKLNYVVDFEPIKWNGILGLYKSFYKHWEMSFQAGFGQRSSITAILGYRF